VPSFQIWINGTGGDVNNFRWIWNASALDDTDMAGVNFKQVDRGKHMLNLTRHEVNLPTWKDDHPMAKARGARRRQSFAPSKAMSPSEVTFVFTSVERISARDRVANNIWMQGRSKSHNNWSVCDRKYKLSCEWNLCLLKKDRLEEEDISGLLDKSNRIALVCILSFFEEGGDFSPGS
jgi:hypothetical protein